MANAKVTFCTFNLKQLSDSPWAQMKAGACARKLQPSTFSDASFFESDDRSRL
jgi:hypothetical protein